MTARLLSCLFLVATGCIDNPSDSCAVRHNMYEAAAQPDDLAMQFQMERCRIDAGACRDLCAAVLDKVQARGEEIFFAPNLDTCSAVIIGNKVYIGWESNPCEPVFEDTPIPAGSGF